MTFILYFFVNKYTLGEILFIYTDYFNFDEESFILIGLSRYIFEKILSIMLTMSNKKFNTKQLSSPEMNKIINGFTQKNLF